MWCHEAIVVDLRCLPKRLSIPTAPDSSGSPAASSSLSSQVASVK